MMDLRRTGRTTRLLNEAEALRAHGKAVYIVCANASHAQMLQAQLPKPSIKCETWWSLGNLNPETLTLPGSWPNVVVLVDHAAIESRFRMLLEMLHRFDLPDQSEGDN